MIDDGKVIIIVSIMIIIMNTYLFYNYNNYVADPHGAIGFLGIKDYLESQEDPSLHQGIFLETAHPIKFANIVEKIIKTKIEFPSQIKGIRNLESNKLYMTDYKELKSFLLAKN